MRERAVRMVREAIAESGERVGAVTRVARQLGIGPESLRNWLSGGQQQRVALARATAVNSRMLLMDEPLSNLDARLRHLLDMQHLRRPELAHDDRARGGGHAGIRLALASRSPAPLYEIVAASRAMYRVCSNGKRDKHTVDSLRMEQRTKQSPSSTPLAPAVSD